MQTNEGRSVYKRLEDRFGLAPEMIYLAVRGGQRVEERAEALLADPDRCDRIATQAELAAELRERAR